MLASPPQQPNLQPGYRLDRYELLYPLAQGGMATVWVARLTGKHGFEKLVAVKTILPQYADDAEFRTMFLDEARIAARIRHLNVAEIMDLGEENGTLFLVMEWVDGDSLARLYNAIIRGNERFPIDVIARIGADACAGLHAAHELRDDTGELLGVVHRDVSPQNILVGANGVTKLIDFGVAKAAQRSSQETSAGLMKGKIQYASPEQAIGRVLDRRSDIWAMGTVLYQMISGRLPYEAENQLAALHMLTSGKPPRPLPPNVPKAVSDVVRRALAFKVEDRYATADEMRAALERAVTPSAGTSRVTEIVAKYLSDRADERRRDVADALAAVSGRSKLPSISNEGASGRLHVMTPSSPSHVVPMPIPPLTTPSRSGVIPQPRSGTLLGMSPPPAPPPPAAPPPAMLAPVALATPMPPTPVPGSISGAVALPSPSTPSARLGAVHYLLGAMGTVMALGVWGVVAMVGLRSGASPQPPSDRAAAAPPVATTAATATAEAPPPPAAPPATAAPVVTTAAPKDPPPPDPPPAVVATSSPPVATTATIAPPPPPQPTAAAPPGPTAAGTAPGVTPPKKKKKKVDDGF